MQFNSTGSKSNHETAMNRLRPYFSAEYIDKLKFVWWFLRAGAGNFPSQISDGGTYIVSGFDGAFINLLMGMEAKQNEVTGEMVQPTMEESVQKALTQPLFLQAKVVD